MHLGKGSLFPSWTCY